MKFSSFDEVEAHPDLIFDPLLMYQFTAILLELMHNVQNLVL